MTTTAGVGTQAAVEQLTEAMRGEVLTPGSAGYDEARMVWNGMYDRRPAVIARCSGVADVMAAVDFARAKPMEVSVRGGGHSASGFGTCDGGLVIDLAPMKGIRVDPESHTVRAEAGLTWGEFDKETQAFGLAVTGGRFSTTGIAGLALGSGSGWLERKCGLTGDNLLSADVVTADGRFVKCSPREKRRPLLGPARRRRQLRHRHLVRVPPARDRADRLRRHARRGAREGRRHPALHARLHGGRAGGPRPRRRVRERATGRVRAAGDALQADHRHRDLLD